MFGAGNLFSLLFSICLFLSPALVSAAVYQVSNGTLQWENLDDSRYRAESGYFKFQYGDDESLVYDLPWPIMFYGQTYNQIIADTNGNLWFNPADPENLPIAYDLISGGKGPVIAVWNSDHNSYYHGGVFIEYKTSPERVVVQWSTGSWNEQGLYRPNYFQVHLTPDSSIRFSYSTLNDASVPDAGSGVSTGDGNRYYNLTQTLGAVATLGEATVSYLHDFDEDGLADVSDPDDDNDGFSDVVEIAGGSDPFDSGSIPGSGPAVPVPAVNQTVLGLAVLVLVFTSLSMRRRD